MTACAFLAGLLVIRSAPSLAAVFLLGWVAFGVAAAFELCAAFRRRQQRHAPFLRPARPTDTP